MAIERLRWLSGALSTHARKITLVVTSLILFYLVIPPIAILLFSSLRDTEKHLPFEPTTFTIGNISQILTSPVTYELLLNSTWYAVGSTTLGLTIAATFAWFLERTNMPFRRFFFVLIFAPIAMPGFILSMAWILLANPTNGLFNVLLRDLFGMSGRGPLNIYSIPGMIFVTALRFVPTMYIMISGVFSRIDPSLEEAAGTSGARRWSTFWHISLPLLSPAILSALVFYLVFAFEVFETAAVLGLSRRIFVFSTMIYQITHPEEGIPNYGLASAYSIILLILCSVLLYLYQRYVRHAERFATVTGRGYRPRLIDLGRWKIVPAIAMSIYFLLGVALPLLILLWTSLAPEFSKFSFSTLSLFSLDAYKRMLSETDLLSATKNSLMIGMTTSVATMLLATLACWMSVRWKGRGTWVPERLAFLILGVPAVVLSVALVIFYVSLPIPIYGTIWIIVIALVTRFLPFGTRLMSAAFLQIHRELEEAAETSGARLFSILTRIVLPLLWPSFMRGLFWVFIRSLTEATVAMMLFTTNNRTIAVKIWFLWMFDGEFALVSAIAVPMVIVSGILAFFVARQVMFVGESV
ncbi:ABC transporter permease [Nitrospinota bacterium]